MLTEKKAIKEVKELWGEIEESGLSKFDFFDSEAGKKWLDKGYQDNCPLCEYVHNAGGCSICPLVLKYDKDCTDLGYAEYPIPQECFDAVKGL